MSRVAILRFSPISVSEAFNLIDFKPASYDLVAIKPDLSISHSYEAGAATNPEVVEEVIKAFENKAKKIVVIDSDTEHGSAEERFVKSGLKTACDYYGVELVNLSKDIKIPIRKNFRALKNFACPRTYLKADLIINIPVMKTEEATTVSLALKNLVGIIPNDKPKYYAKLSDVICDILSIRKPELNIIDATIAREGGITVRQRAKKLNLILASRDIVALDTIACKVMRLNPAHVDHIQKAAYYGYGEANPERIEVVGELIENVWDKFIL